MQRRLFLVLVASLVATAAHAAEPPGPTWDEEAAFEEPHPTWLIDRSFTKGYKIVNSIPVEREDKGLRLRGAPEYRYQIKTGNRWSDGGTWEVDEDGKLALSGYGGTIDLRTALRASCRVLDTPAFGRLYA